MEKHMRIQAIFDALSHDFPKKALHLSTKAMKKYPEFQIFQALNALSLLRIGQQKKALEMCENLKKNIPTDQDVLNVLQLVFKELNMENEIVKIFENALKKMPNDEELVKNWFFSMVRINNIIGQQKAAMNLQKTFGRRKYYYWAVMSLQLFEIIDMDENERLLFRTLAYRLAMKMVEENNELYKLSSSEELHLYINVLLSFGKVEDVINILESDFGKRFMDVDLLRLKLDLLFKLEKWTLLFSQCRDHIDCGNNDWKIFNMHIISALNLATFDISSSIILDLVDYYRKKKEEFRFSPNFYLAFLKLSFTVPYFQTFAIKTSCFENLRFFVGKLERNDQIVFLADIKAFCNEVGLKEIKKRNYVEVLKNVEKFEYFINYYELKDENAWIVFSSRLIQEYKDSLFLDNDLGFVDNQYGDDFLILAVHALFNVFFTTHKQGYLIEAILLLEIGLLHSKHNFQFKLLLIRLYSMIAFSIYQSLSIKQIQYDTLSYVFLTKCSNYYPSKSLQDELKATKTIYLSNIREVPEMLVLAYENGSYSNISNFIEFGIRLNNSIWRHVLKYELLHLSYLIDDNLLCEIIENNGFTQEKYYDNRDFNIMSNFGAFESESIRVKSRITSMPDENWLKIQNFKMSFLSLLTSGTFEDIKLKFKSRELLLPGLKNDILSEFETQMISLLRIFLYLLIEDADQNIYNFQENKLKEWIERNFVISFLNSVDYDHTILEHLVFLFESCKSIILFENFVKKYLKTHEKLYLESDRLKQIVRKFYNDIILSVSLLKEKVSINATEFIDMFEPNFELFKINKCFVLTKIEKINESRRNSLDNLDYITYNIKF
ncbi:hypothetical protein PMAC_000305 [Pneumocystis sp. 'macacae']|nr:hypothetical protein PMAC_000305 [Pneumocystis sp. 'macacae']